jgi:hypothetical protein
MNRIDPKDMPPEDTPSDTAQQPSAQGTPHMHIIAIDYDAPTPAASIAVPVFRDASRSTVISSAMHGGALFTMYDGLVKMTRDDPEPMLHRVVLYEHLPDEWSLGLYIWNDGRAVLAREKAEESVEMPDALFVVPMKKLLHLMQHVAADTSCKAQPDAITFADGKPRAPR